MTMQAKPATKSKRIHWMDNLRTITIFLIVLYHIGGVYESAGIWAGFWLVDDPATISWVGMVGIVFDIFAIATLFFISGYLTPASLKTKTGWEFIKGKAKRLLLPWAIAVLTLIPIYKVIFLYSRGLSQEHWTTYFHFTNPNGQNWLWFLPMLFVFSLLYLLLDKLNIKFSKLSLTWAVVGTFILGFAYSFISGNILGFRSWTYTPVLDFENERIVVYFLSFLVGALCFQKNVFAEKPKSKTLYTVANSLAWLPVTGHIFARIWPFFVPDFTFTPLYQLLWWLSFHLSLISMVYTMVETFWRYFDKTGKLWTGLNRNSYGVYIIHVIMIGIFATLLLNTGLPAIVKYLLVIFLTYAGSNGLVAVYRRLMQTILGK